MATVRCLYEILIQELTTRGPLIFLVESAHSRGNLTVASPPSLSAPLEPGR